MPLWSDSEVTLIPTVVMVSIATVLLPEIAQRLQALQNVLLLSSAYDVKIYEELHA
jgi:hypothetical protein